MPDLNYLMQFAFLETLFKLFTAHMSSITVSMSAHFGYDWTNL